MVEYSVSGWYCNGGVSEGRFPIAALIRQEPVLLSSILLVDSENSSDWLRR